MKAVKIVLTLLTVCIALGVTGCIHTHREVVVEHPVAAPPAEVIVKPN